MDDLISTTDSFPAAAAYQFAQVAVFCNIEQIASEVSTKASTALSIMVTDYESLDNFVKQLEIYIPLIAHATSSRPVGCLPRHVHARSGSNPSGRELWDPAQVGQHRALCPDGF